MEAFNAALKPLLATSAAAAGSSAASGVIGLTVTESDAHACAAALNERWQLGQISLHYKISLHYIPPFPSSPQLHARLTKRDPNHTRHLVPQVHQRLRSPRPFGGAFRCDRR